MSVEKLSKDKQFIRLVNRFNKIDVTKESSDSVAIDAECLVYFEKLHPDLIRNYSVRILEEGFREHFGCSVCDGLLIMRVSSCVIYIDLVKMEARDTEHDTLVDLSKIELGDNDIVIKRTISKYLRILGEKISDRYVVFVDSESRVTRFLK